MVAILTAVALAIASMTLAAILWSVAQPDRRIWPPHRFSAAVAWIGWGGTFAFFATVFALGVIGWGDAPVPGWLRYGVGAVLILAGNAGVWSEVMGFGVNQTMGAEGQLKTDGLYRFSRNPQYVSDIAILIGWALLSASFVAQPSVITGVLVLIAFPLAEESWLSERYGKAYLDYKAKVRRFL
ncbi:protein-S-isoprenylcysteine O-methyltransferase Ste14 [Loktanella ponticola]|uniref:Protein-S-isoprenylcysteine O-methyltransferase Ste14 n=1 Tax=Yoonia ponticola TaxID=1524255 RepID=A0A7W9BMV9_9RHOB|nr:isoprenylcysteine carboxylmethyltransferase family protein [Yoonia ponticola]MBB5723360.1 protein-S-isoprenylcysteine O-methyltransferase Ste14 [Yoonia ponticola]